MTRWLLDRDRLWTPNLVPGRKVYGEPLRRIRGAEHRAWSPRRSKLAAYLTKGGRALKLKGRETVLYLGAASGTTVSHLSDLVPDGRVVAVEFSARPFRDLVDLAATRPNIVPVLADARAPAAYEAYLDAPADVLVQDIAQRDLDAIFLANVDRYAAAGAGLFLSVKARSVNVAGRAEDVYRAVRKSLEAGGVRVAESWDLEPFQVDHALLYAKR